MPNLLSYTDYRKYLSDCLAQRKSSDPSFSLRDFAESASIDQGNLSRVLANRRRLTADAAVKISRALGHKKREQDYLIILVRYNETSDHREKKACFEEMLAFKDAPVTVVASDQYEFYSRWYYTAVREVLAFFPFNGTNARELGRLLRPSISARQVQQSIALLEKLGLILKTADGVYQRTDAVISSGHDVQAVALNNFVVESMKLAEATVGKMPGEINLSSVALTINQADFAAVQEEIRECRRRILEIARRSEGPDRVYAMNVQIFPLTSQYKGGK